MGTVLLLIDNSNIHIGGKSKYDVNARFSYAKLERVCAGGDEIIEKHLAGSTPPANDAFWYKMRHDGYKVWTYERVSAGYGHYKEKAVDMSIGVMGGAAIERLKPDRVVLLTGDRDFVPIAELRDEMRTRQGHTFILDIWAYSDSLSPEIERVSDNVFIIENYEKELIFFQYKDGTIESFIEREERIAAEKIEREEKWKAHKAEEAEREAERAKTVKKTWGNIGKVVLGGSALAGIYALIRKVLR